MVILPRNSPADLIEQRLRGIGEGGIPTAQEIINAAGAGTGRRGARLQNWAVSALARIGANAEALAMQRRAAHTSRGESAPSGSGTRAPTAEELAEAGL